MYSKCPARMAAFILLAAPAVFASGPSFHPEFVINGANLEGWTMFGNATWTPGNGEVRATRTTAAGWCSITRSRTSTSTEFRCSAGCETGVLLRAEKTPDGGMKGIYVSLSDPDTGEYAVTIDAKGKIPIGRNCRAEVA